MPRTATLTLTIAVGATAVAVPATLAATPITDPVAARAGQLLYRHGQGRQGTSLQGRVAASVELSGAAVACARCHGLSGGGLRDAGLQVPPLRWAELNRARPAGPGVIGRPAYDESSLIRALRDGVDAGGRPLGAAMPRFDLSPRAAADLVQHLRQIGTEAEPNPGVERDRILLGTVLPRGAGEQGRALVAGVRACLDRANRTGGIYGRQVVLEVLQAPADPATLQVAAAEWGERVLMLVAPWWPQDSAASLAAALGPMPVLGPLGEAAEIDEASSWWFGVVPQRADQVRVLVDRVAFEAKQRGGRIGLIAASDAASQASLRAANRQAAFYDEVQAISETVRDLDDLKRVMRSWSQGGFPKGVVALLPPPLLQALLAYGAEVADGSTTWVYALLQQQGSQPLAWPAPLHERLRLATAAPTAEAFDPRPWQADLRAIGEAPALAPVQVPAYASACAAVEALRQAGRALDRESLVRGLQQVQRLETGVMAPIGYGPRQRSGIWDSRLVRVAPDGRNFVPAGERLSPRLAP
jgi:ABC-type branched-subunit amino acid transport system substrate-binding protein/cytochrome c553